MPTTPTQTVDLRRDPPNLADEVFLDKSRFKTTELQRRVGTFYVNRRKNLMSHVFYSIDVMRKILHGRILNGSLTLMSSCCCDVNSLGRWKTNENRWSPSQWKLVNVVFQMTMFGQCAIGWYRIWVVACICVFTRRQEYTIVWWLFALLFYAVRAETGRIMSGSDGLFFSLSLLILFGVLSLVFCVCRPSPSGDGAAVSRGNKRSLFTVAHAIWLHDSKTLYARAFSISPDVSTFHYHFLIFFYFSYFFSFTKWK